MELQEKAAEDLRSQGDEPRQQLAEQKEEPLLEGVTQWIDKEQPSCSNEKFPRHTPDNLVLLHPRSCHQKCLSMNLRYGEVFSQITKDSYNLIKKQPHQIQLAHLRSCLTSEMWSTLAHVIGLKDEDMQSVEEVLGKTSSPQQCQRNVL